LNLYERLKLNAVWRVVLFSFLIHFFTSVGNAASFDVEFQWCNVKPWVDGLFTQVLAQLITAVGIWYTQTYHLNTSWQWLLWVSISCMVFLSLLPAVLIDLNVIRSQYFFAGAPLLQAAAQGMFFIVCGYCAVEVAEKGSEGITYGFITTVGNLAIPFASLVSSNLASLFQLYDENKVLDDSDAGRKRMLALDFTVAAINLLAIPTIYLLPPQKKEIQALIKSGATHERAAFWILIALAFALLWSLLGNLLSIFKSTSCLQIIGGKGC
jgi:hypothetical protein